MLAVLLPLSASAGVLQRPRIRQGGTKRLLSEAKFEYPYSNHVNMWGEFLPGHDSPNHHDIHHQWYEEPDAWKHPVVKEPKGTKGAKGHKPKHPLVQDYSKESSKEPHYDDASHEESKLNSDDGDPHPWEHEESKLSSEDPHPWEYEESNLSSDDPHPWHDPRPWGGLDSSDEDAWGAGYPDATKPSYHDLDAWYNEPDAWTHHPTVKGAKGNNEAKGTKGVVDKDKASKGEKPVPPHAKDPYPEPHPVSKDKPKDPVPGHYPHHPDSEDGSITEKRVVIPLVLQFDVQHARIPKEHELDAITAQTDVFLSTYLDKFFDEYILGVFLDYFTLVQAEGVHPIVDNGIISVEYKAITFFETIVIPSVGDMAFILEEAFLNENLDEYLRRVNTLPHTNIFASTTEVSILVHVPDSEPYKLIKSLQEEETKSIAAQGGGSTSKVSLLALTTIIAAAALVTSAVALVAFRRKRPHNEEDDLSFVEGVFVGDKNTLVEQEIGDDDFEVSSCSSGSKATRAENFLRLVARDEDDCSGNSTFRIEMGGNKAFSRA